MVHQVVGGIGYTGDSIRLYTITFRYYAFYDFTKIIIERIRDSIACPEAHVLNADYSLTQREQAA